MESKSGQSKSVMWKRRWVPGRAMGTIHPKDYYSRPERRNYKRSLTKTMGRGMTKSRTGPRKSLLYSLRMGMGGSPQRINTACPYCWDAARSLSHVHTSDSLVSCGTMQLPTFYPRLAISSEMAQHF
jgi:hypothetical protein